MVYGAASAVGAFAIQLAVQSNIHPIIGVAGNGIPFAESLIDPSKGDAIVDYRKGDEAVVSGISDALKKAGISSGKAAYVYDAVSEKGSQENIVEILESDGYVTGVLPPALAKRKDFEYPAGINASTTMVGDVHQGEKDFGFIFYRYFIRLIQEGRFKAHPYEVVPGGLAGVSTALKNLRDGKASAVKYVFKIADTEGAGKD